MKDTGELIDGVEPYIIKEVGGLDIGIIGVTSLKPQDRGWEEVSDKVFESGDITVTNLMEEVAPQTDINIVLSHTGLAVDTKTCRVEGVSAVVGADDHFVIPSPCIHRGRTTARPRLLCRPAASTISSWEDWIWSTPTQRGPGPLPTLTDTFMIWKAWSRTRRFRI